MTEQKWIKWDPDNGIIESNFGRLVMYAEGFIRGFIEELTKSGGTALEKMVIKDMALSIGIDYSESNGLNWRSFEDKMDQFLSPFEEINNKPAELEWDGKSRNMKYGNFLKTKLWPLKTIGAFKSSAEKALTERGANAIIGQASRKAGREFANSVGKAFNWDSMDKVISSMGGIMPQNFRTLGWGKLELFMKAEDRVVVFVMKGIYEAEVGGDKASLTILKNQIEGIGESLAKKESLSVKCKEVDSPLGGDTRIVVLKLSGSGEDVDWDLVPWREMVA
ncbi:MAG: hypothetical protein JW984_04050 [Deltaproteobacteria bacterium]|uniref:Uncharacterized protein n=1 Tax=Candidatus Zymogenus saltonus TaxID=2844893 RepID=A0A9D8KES0_9DELT|nr:hypothetical protein [Candidatus Zymogenus saltonus]